MKLFRLAMRAALLAVILVAGAGFGASEGHAKDMKFFRIVSGSAGGTYFPMAGLLAQVISSPPGAASCEKGGSCGVPGMIAIAQSSPGSVANVTMVEAGEAESAFAQSDVVQWAVTGTGIFKGKPPKEKLRVIASLYPEPVHVVATVGSKVEKIEDLKGKRVGIGLPESGAIVDARIVLEAANLKEKTGFVPVYENSADTIASMAAGETDAMIAVSGFPQPAIHRLAASEGISLLPIDGKMRERILKKNKFLAAGTIPAGTYPGVEEEVPTIVVSALWITSADQPEELIYQITRALWHERSRKLLDDGHPMGKLVRPENALIGVATPVHPGAARYYREIGLLP